MNCAVENIIKLMKRSEEVQRYKWLQECLEKGLKNMKVKYTS
jgi:hypothetical protein